MARVATAWLNSPLGIGRVCLRRAEASSPLSSHIIRHVPLKHNGRRTITTIVPPEEPLPGSCYVRYDSDGKVPFLSLTQKTRSVVFRLQPAKPVSVLLEAIREEFGAEHVALGSDGVRWARSTVLGDAMAFAHARGGVPATGTKGSNDVIADVSTGLADNEHAPGSLTMFLDATPLRIALPSFSTRTRHLQAAVTGKQAELSSLQNAKISLDRAAAASATRLAWTGLLGLCAQWGLMARLTWWEYSWDVMEPISYFITFGTGILGYMFYTVTRREATWESLGSMTVSRRQMKLYTLHRFDLRRYVDVNAELEELQGRLAGIRHEYGVDGAKGIEW